MHRGGGDEEVLSAFDDMEQIRVNVERFKAMWANEKAAPDILVAENIAILNFSERVKKCELALQDAEATIRPILQLDVDRNKFLLKDYFRARLVKLDKHPEWYLKTEERRMRLLPHEMAFLQKYMSAHEEHDSTLLWSKVSERIRLEGGDMSDPVLQEECTGSGPNVDAFCFCEVVGEEFSFREGDDQTPEDSQGGAGGRVIQLGRGMQHIVSYKRVRDKVESGDVNLL
uniref:DNA replication complex GINS protein SLD5 n=1 Tax=Chromera velia CCMP2878 TaxID=1169474 RepID=A0A0G4FMQ9_9ALVE|eukprot:Cvel_17840.t1-p1 / transcript=Cvel_17840.t1 / gene=Cvel_17840 / organism=Chromera_velia_CCMP2878 / gene_product=DNA replication complex GINS protein SLD5, putative / transcript_product=DNA replication complex GINS protein SLD5, putative / location=Cvel_scaffold1446:23484-26452(-) / protein_length=228 / sequence_SO=supercontig / SO=protein_coding / is_pseudo=false